MRSVSSSFTAETGIAGEEAEGEAESSSSSLIDSDDFEGSKPLFVISNSSRKSRSISLYNFCTSLASKVMRKRKQAKLAYRIFHSGLLPDQDEEAVFNDRKAIIETVKRGLDLRSDKDSLFETFVKSRIEVDMNSPHPIRTKTHKSAKKTLLDCADKLVSIGDSVLVAIKSPSAGTMSIYNSELKSKIDATLRRICGIDLLELINRALSEDISSTNLIDFKKKRFDESNSKIRKALLIECLLECYQRDCRDTSAKNIPWSRVNLIGWPDQVSPEVHLLSSSSMKKVYYRAVAGSITFSKLSE